MAGWKALLLAFSLFVSINAQINDGYCPSSCQTGACCSNFLMDNPRKAVIDFNATVEPGSYGGVAVKLCTNDPFALDLWAPVVAGQDLMEFRWTEDFPGVNNGWKQIQREGETWWAFNFSYPLNLTREHYVGIMGMTDKIPVPYSNNAVRDPNRRGREQVNFQSITLGNPERGNNAREIRHTRANIETFPWQRSFQPFIHFCPPGGCIDEAFCVGCRGPPGRPGPPGPPGPPGKPGINSPTCAFDAPDEFNGKLNKVQTSTDEILKEITKIDGELKKIGGGDRATGICPSEFMTGSYGVGNCYLVMNTRKTFGEAAIDCIGTRDSHLVDIANLNEDTFLASTVAGTIQNTETNRTYWTSGIYSRNMRQWVWYDEKRFTTTILTYQNWATDEALGYTRRKNCLVLQVFRDKTYRWISAECTGSHYFICKKRKECY